MDPAFPTFVAAWIGLGAVFAPVTYGLVFAECRGEWGDVLNSREDVLFDRRCALFLAVVTLFFPPTVISIWVSSDFGKYGLRFR